MISKLRRFESALKMLADVDGKIFRDTVDVILTDPLLNHSQRFREVVADLELIAEEIRGLPADEDGWSRYAAESVESAADALRYLLGEEEG